MMWAYRKRKATLNYAEGTLKEQYLRLYDYTHELLRSNPNNITKLKVQPTDHKLRKMSNNTRTMLADHYLQVSSDYICALMVVREFSSM